MIGVILQKTWDEWLPYLATGWLVQFCFFMWVKDRQENRLEWFSDMFCTGLLSYFLFDIFAPSFYGHRVVQGVCILMFAVLERLCYQVKEYIKGKVLETYILIQFPIMIFICIYTIGMLALMFFLAAGCYFFGIDGLEPLRNYVITTFENKYSK